MKRKMHISTPILPTNFFGMVSQLIPERTVQVPIGTKTKSASKKIQEQHIGVIQNLFQETSIKLAQNLLVAFKAVNEMILEVGISKERAKEILESANEQISFNEISEVLECIGNPMPDNMHVSMHHMSLKSLLEEVQILLVNLQKIADSNLSQDDVNSFLLNELKKDENSRPALSGIKAIDFIKSL